MLDWIPKEVLDKLGWALVLIALAVGRLLDRKSERWKRQIHDIHTTLLDPRMPDEVPLVEQIRHMHAWLGEKDQDGTTISRIRQQHQQSLDRLTDISERQAKTMEAQTALHAQLLTLQQQTLALLTGIQQEVLAIGADRRGARRPAGR